MTISNFTWRNIIDKVVILESATSIRHFVLADTVMEKVAHVFVMNTPNQVSEPHVTNRVVDYEIVTHVS